MIKDELAEIKKKYGDARRTQLKADEGEFDVQDLIAEEDVVITVSRAGYVKRQPIDAFKRQGRGGRGIKGATLKEEDVITDVFTTTTHNWLLFFSTRGKVYRVKVHEVPDSSRIARGLYAANLPGVSVNADEKVSAVLDLKEYAEGRFLLFATKHGMVKKTALPEYASARTGLAAINLKTGDELVDVRLTDGKDDVFLISRRGQAIRFKEALVRPMGRATAGVIGMRLAEGDEVISLALASDGEEMISVYQDGPPRGSLRGLEGPGPADDLVGRQGAAGRRGRHPTGRAIEPGRPHDAGRRRRERRGDRPRHHPDGRGVAD
ncbi:MAG: hypothetical protein E6G65_03070 [Actinobacteria bacterium]|nr:MAG: hypothetical protein E6G65_03070 [Actinomycetota bacterium]